MSAALQLPGFFQAGIRQTAWREQRKTPSTAAAVENIDQTETKADELPVSLAFYRKHTESMLRRYLYASMQVGRAPSILSEPIARGWYQAGPSGPLRTQ